MSARKKTAASTPARKTARRTTSKTARTASPASAGKRAPVKSSASVKKSAPPMNTPVKKKAGTRPAARKTPRSQPGASDQLTEYRRKRDFEKTAEPSGIPASSGRARSAPRAPRRGELRFVIQKHSASHLHYDLRLEVDGVMKSWAVPKGPSADPSVKRLAMQVEDHPVEYNTFEGTIPSGEYGGGTVMLWDSGTYSIEDAAGRPQNSAAHEEYERGEMKLDFHGKRIQGSYALVRTRGMPGARSSRPSWLLIKHRDEDARPERESSLTEQFTTSVTTGRSMDEIRDAD